MALLIGRYDYSLDPKNRLAVPPKYRETLAQEKGRSFYLTGGMEGCLYLFLPAQWEKLLADDLRMFSLPDKEQERAFKRKFFSEAVEVEPDAQGRILVPQYLKEHAGLRFDVLVQGAGNRAEIWDSKRWAAYEKSTIAPAYKKIGKSLEI
ncbi:MAG: division/cell wall cluster transcriptional repressor MraZ [Elusimicrobia bacterium]|nr:division/cell wall cluster transcriptional repressor MraZ [Elusimicrobiota bacterium]